MTAGLAANGRMATIREETEVSSSHRVAGKVRPQVTSATAHVGTSGYENGRENSTGIALQQAPSLK